MLRNLLILTVCCTVTVFAQRTVQPTDTILISGNIKRERVITTAQLEGMKSVPLQNHVITNHRGEVKDTLTGLQGVSLKTILDSVDFVYEKPKELSKYAIVLVATDGYTVVYSWNELFNSPTGNSVYLLTQVNGKPLHSCPDRLYSLCVSDVNSGRRFVIGLSAIKIKQL